MIRQVAPSPNQHLKECDRNDQCDHEAHRRSPEPPLRSSLITEKWHIDHICGDLFDLRNHNVRSYVNKTNTFYGGRFIASGRSGSAVDRIIFINGGLDPWRQLSVVSAHPNEILGGYLPRSITPSLMTQTTGK